MSCPSPFFVRILSRKSHKVPKDKQLSSRATHDLKFRSISSCASQLATLSRPPRPRRASDLSHRWTVSPQPPSMFLLLLVVLQSRGLPAAPSHGLPLPPCHRHPCGWVHYTPHQGSWAASGIQPNTFCSCPSDQACRHDMTQPARSSHSVILVYHCQEGGGTRGTGGTFPGRGATRQRVPWEGEEDPLM